MSNNVVIVSRETGEFWFLDLEDCGDMLPFATAMTGAGSRGSTAGLLNGAVALGLGNDLGVLRLCTTSLPKYVLDLVSSYHNSRRTVGNYLKAAKRFRTLDRLDIATYLERHAREENGHERLALRDISALNLPAERIVANLVPKGVAALCDLFDNLSSSDYPIGCIGYSYFFESSAAKRQKADVEALQALCPPGVDATRFIRAHSSLGSEVDHVKDMITFIASMPAFDRIEIVKATYATAVTVSNGIDRSGPKSDSAMWAEIRSAAGEEVSISN
ncbi:MAG: hypothetical protein AABM64_03705 [Pseudomonadota bacterium]